MSPSATGPYIRSFTDEPGEKTTNPHDVRAVRSFSQPFFSSLDAAMFSPTLFHCLSLYLFMFKR